MIFLPPVGQLDAGLQRHVVTDGISAGCLSLLHVEDGHAWWLARVE